MRNHISKQQFEKASRVAADFREMISDRDEKVRQKTLDEQFALPSYIWQQQTELFSYCYDPSYEVVDTWRLHTIIFTGNYMGYGLADDAPIPGPMRLRYERFTAGLPDRLIYRAPEICAERGYRVNGAIVNKDTLMYQAHLAALYRSGAMAYLETLGDINILEIGGGYGGLAHALKQIFPTANITMVDLLESLLFAGVYLSVVSPDHFEFVSNHTAVADLPDGKFDLVINTGSLGEMTAYQVEAYANLVMRVLSPRGIFYEENGGVNVGTGPFLKGKFKRVTAYLPPKYVWFLSDEVGKNMASLMPPAAPFSASVFFRDAMANVKARLLSVVHSWRK